MTSKNHTNENPRDINPQKPGYEEKPGVLVLTTSYPSDRDDWSGVFIAKLLGALRKRGYGLKVVAPSNGTFHGRRILDGIDTVRFGYFRPRSLERLTRGAGGIPENMAGSLLARIQLAPMMLAFLFASLRELRSCQVIYANWLGAGIVGAILNLLTGKPLVLSFRGDDGYLARDRTLWRMLTKWVGKRCSTIVPVSAELLHIVQGLGIPDEKCRLFRFGVDTEMFHPPVEARPPSTEVRLLFVGSLIVRKGLQELLEALAEPTFSRVKLIVVGEGTYGPDLEAMSERLGLADRVEWKGILPPAEVARLMRSVDLLCLPSHMEGRPNVVNEAMASGLPVISTRIGGIPDMVREGESALLFTPGNVDELRQCLHPLVSDSERRSRMGQAGHDFVIDSGTSWDSTAEEFDKLFSELSRGSVSV